MNDSDLSLDNEDSGVAIHNHFEAFGRWEWTEIADEACRVFELLFGQEVDDGSPLDYFVCAIGEQSAEGVWHAVAAAFGVSVEAVQDVTDDWYANQDSPPPPIGAEEFMRRCAEFDEYLDRKKKEISAQSLGDRPTPL